MKFRIIGTILVLGILVALFLVVNNNQHHAPSNSSQQIDDSSNGLQGLKIN